MDKNSTNSLEARWQETLKEYRKIVGTPKAVQPVENISQVDKNGAITKSIESVGVIAKRATTLASPVCGQAQTVLEALEYLAGTVRFFKQNFTPVKVLPRLQQVSWNLERINGYIKAYEDDALIEESLMRVISRIMTVFLRLCTIYAKVDSNSKKASGYFKNSFKSMIRWDGGIQDCIEEIEDLTNQELNVNVAALRVSDIEEKRRRLQQEDTRKLQSLLSVARMGDHWTRIQKTLEEQQISRLGDWLFDESSIFNAWADVHQCPDDPMLWVVGDHGYGKTSLCSRAITYLKKQYPNEDQSRIPQVSLAWFFLQRTEAKVSSKQKKGSKSDRKTLDSKNDSSIRDALQAIIWQLTQSDRAFQKFVVEKLRKGSQAGGTSLILWMNLLKEFCLSTGDPGKRSRKVFFLIIDGADTMTDDALIRVWNDVREICKSCNDQNSACQVRIMVTREEVATKKNADVGSEVISAERAHSQETTGWASKIELPRDSRHFDAQIFIEHHLQDLFKEFLRGTDGYRVLHSLEKKLISMFWRDKSNYHVLTGLLEEIKRIGAGNRVLHGLRDLDKKLDQDDTIIVQLEILNRELRAHEKDVLNGIISCLHFFEITAPTIQQVDAFLTLHGQQVPGAGVGHLIRTRFSDIITVMPDQKVVAEKLISFLNDQECDKPWSAQTEEENFKNFHQTHTEELERLAGLPVPSFNDWTDTMFKITGQRKIARPKLQFNCIYSNTLGLTVLLRSVCSEDHKDLSEIGCLQSYAGLYLTEHLWFESDPNHLGDKENNEINKMREEIGRHLHQFFMDKHCVRLWLSQSDPQSLIDQDWCIYLDDIRTWLRDQNVWSGFQGARERFAERETSNVASMISLQDEGDEDDEAATGDTTPTIPTADRQNDEVYDPLVGETTESVRGTENRHDSVETTESNVVNLVPAESLIQGGDTQGSRTILRESEEKNIEISKAQREIVTSPPSNSAGDPEASLFRSESGQIPQQKRESDLSLLPWIVKISAALWLQHFEWNASQALRWLILVTHKAITLQEEDTTNLNLKPENANLIEEIAQAINKNGNLKKKTILQAGEWVSALLDIREHSNRSSIKDVRLAQTLFEMNAEEDHAEAEKRCELAQHHDPFPFEATLCLSKIFECNGNKTKALKELLNIRWHLQGVDFQEKSPVRWRDELDRFWRLCRATNSVKEALLACRILSDQPLLSSAEYIDEALAWIRDTKHLRGAFGVLSTIRETEEQSLLTAILHSAAASDEAFHQHIYLALKDDPSLLLKGYTDAILGSVDPRTTPFLCHWYGISLFYQGEIKKALFEWEDTCSKLKSRTNEPEAVTMLARTAERLASAYIGAAQNGGKGKKGLARYIANLKTWKNWIDSHGSFIFNYLALLLGRLYYITNQSWKAREAIRAHLTAAFELLEDDRKDNDRKGHFGIAEAVLYLDDESNARTAWSLVACVTLDDKEREKQEQEDDQEEEEGKEERRVQREANKLSITCTGGCGWEWDGSADLKKDLYLCRDCAHVRFESSCYKKLINGSLEERVCRKDHNLTKIPKLRPDDRKRIASGYVLGGKAGKAVKIESWLSTVRHQYGILKPNQHWSASPVEKVQMAKWKLKRTFDSPSSGRAVATLK